MLKCNLITRAVDIPTCCVSHCCGTVVLFHSIHLKGFDTETGILISIIRSAQWGFLGFGFWFFFLTSAVLDFSKSEGAEKIIFSLSVNRWLGS